MASIDANASSGTRLQDTPHRRRCENCGREMLQLAAFPAIARRKAVMIFRCYGCNHVVSEDSHGSLAARHLKSLDFIGQDQTGLREPLD